MLTYLDLLRRVRDHGIVKEDRTGVGTRSLFGHQLRFDLAEGFPLLTTKRVHWKSVAQELLWFLRGESNVKSLRESGVSIWDEWAGEDGELGPVYGVQWRSWPKPDGGSIDQLGQVLEEIRARPDSRRLIVSAWNVAEIARMALPPCHLLYQFYVAEGKLSLQVYQRSADIFLGLPFNIASYALLLAMVAQVSELAQGDLVFSLGDVHLYSNHLEQASEQLSRAPRALPRLQIDPAVHCLWDFRFEHFELQGYDPHPRIAAPVAV